jgi:hypothetical protein
VICGDTTVEMHHVKSVKVRFRFEERIRTGAKLNGEPMGNGLGRISGNKSRYAATTIENITKVRIKVRRTIANYV